MTNAPADTQAATTQGTEPRLGLAPLTRAQKVLGGIVVVGLAVIAAIGFAGSYHSVTALAAAKGFGSFARYFTIGVDSGIGVLLALDLLLTWIRIPFPLLRQTAWFLTAATIVFNAATAWPDPIGSGMHAVIPILFVITVEAARHAIGRIANITADKHIESPPITRWIVAFPSTFRIWRRQRKFNVRSYETVLDHYTQISVYRAHLRDQYGRRYRAKAPAEKILVLRLATTTSMTIAQAIALPEDEARKREADRLAREEAARREEVERLEAVEEQRLIEEQARVDRERIQREADAEANRLAAEERLAEEERERQRRIADAENQAHLAEINDGLRQREQDRLREQDDQERIRRQEQLDHATALAAIAKQKADNEAKAREEAERTRKEKERLALIEAAARTPQVRGTTNANSRTSEPATTGTSANREPQVQNRATNPGTTNPGTTNPANREPRTAASNPRTVNPANLGDRAAAKRNQIENVLNLIDELGYDAATLGVVIERTGMTKTTAYHRLTEARGLWNQRQAS